MYKTCNTVQSAQRQQSIQKALFHLMETQNYSEITITALCKEAQIHRNSFYRYFDTIEDVLYGEMDAMIRESSLVLYEKPDIRTYFQFWQRHTGFLDILQKHGLSSMFEIRAQMKMIAQSTAEPLSFSFMRDICFLAGVMNLMIAWHHTGMKHTPEEMEEIFWQIFRKE